MSLSTLNVILVILLTGASIALYFVLLDVETAHPNRRLRSAARGNDPRLFRRLSVLARKSVLGRQEPHNVTSTQARLRSDLGYAGFREWESVAVFQIVRGLAMLGLAMVGVVLGASALRSSVLGAASGCAIGYILPTFAIHRIARARQRKIIRELPDLLALLVVSLEAGVGMNEAIRLVGRETEHQGQVLGRELTTTVAQMSAGLSLEESLKDLGERNGVDELKSLVALAIQSDKIGGSIAPALRASADLLNSRRRLSAEEAANKSSVKMLIPMVFLILPAMMLIVLGPAVIQIIRMFQHTG
jgi:tight adherence protein C